MNLHTTYTVRCYGFTMSGIIDLFISRVYKYSRT